MQQPSDLIDESRDISYDPVIRNGDSKAQDLVMEHFQQILPKVWREVCRHIEIGESADTLFQLLRGYVPVERMAVYRLEDEHRRLVAASAVPPWPGQPARSEDVPERQFRKL